MLISKLFLMKELIYEIVRLTEESNLNLRKDQ
nr:MAG TPA: hypothetical protein [Caudoviricetes sp.]